ncbi:MAG: IS1 family transposase [Verrucomicrobia bacterium]|nr:IS1 family transposase [Cytophagales bacterium]
MNACPHCGSVKFVKNGTSYYGKQNYLCRHCKRQFVERHQKQVDQALIGRLLLERISLAGICRVLQISMSVLMRVTKQIWETMPQELPLSQKISQVDVFCLEADELWSFVGSKANKQWIWLAIDRQTNLIVGFHLGERDGENALGLWLSIPELIREQAFFFTDNLPAYREVFGKKQHRAEGKRETLKIERFNNTLRQRCSRLVRKTLSFSKKWEHHYLAIFYFLIHYNLDKMAT